MRWLLLLEGSENQEILKTLEEIAMQDSVLHQAMAAWEKTSDDPKVREEYFARRKVVLDEMAAVREVEIRLREAMQKGKVEGKAEVAKNLIDLGMEISKVAKATGMTDEEVKRLKA